MRKTLSLVLALLLLLCMGACGEAEQPADSSSSHAGLSSVVVIESEDETSEEEAPPPEAPTEWVYVSRTGKCYHSLSYCSNMQSPLKMSKAEAIERGRRPCQNCY